MTTHVTSRRVAFAAAGGLLAALTLSGAAQAITDNVFRYTNPRTGHFAIGVMAMAPQEDDATYVVSWVGGALSSTSSHCFNAGVNLPHGATMTRLTVWYSSGAGSNIFVALRRHALANGGSEILVSEVVPNDSTVRTQKNFALTAGARVNNARYAYGFGVCLGTNTVFRGARVTYTYNHAGD